MMYLQEMSNNASALMLQTKKVHFCVISKIVLTLVYIRILKFLCIESSKLFLILYDTFVTFLNFTLQ